MKHTTRTAAAMVATILLGLGLGFIPAPSQAATFTPYIPTPHATEVDLDDILAPFLADGYERIPDNLDTLFPVPGYQEFYVLAFEDLPLALSDGGVGDFNDVVLTYNSLTQAFSFVAGYSADTHSWYQAAGVIYLDSGQTCCGTQDFSSLSSPDRMLSFGKPMPESVPEPASVALLGAGLLGVVVMARRRRARG